MHLSDLLSIIITPPKKTELYRPRDVVWDKRRSDAVNKQGYIFKYPVFRFANIVTAHCNVSLCQTERPLLLFYYVITFCKVKKLPLLCLLVHTHFFLFLYHITSNKISLHSFDILCLGDTSLETSKEVSDLGLESFCLADMHLQTVKQEDKAY